MASPICCAMHLPEGHHRVKVKEAPEIFFFRRPITYRHYGNWHSRRRQDGKLRVATQLDHSRRRHHAESFRHEVISRACSPCQLPQAASLATEGTRLRAPLLAPQLGHELARLSHVGNWEIVASRRRSLLRQRRLDLGRLASWVSPAAFNGPMPRQGASCAWEYIRCSTRPAGSVLTTDVDGDWKVHSYLQLGRVNAAGHCPGLSGCQGDLPVAVFRSRRAPLHLVEDSARCIPKPMDSEPRCVRLWG